MDPLRHQYLDAMGIQLWQRREQEQPAQEEPTPREDLTGIKNLSGFEHPTPQEAPSPPPDTSTLGWPALQQLVGNCQRCPQLAASRTQTVFGVGNRQAEWLIIGEAPGADEDRQGEPFVGRAGKLLDAMLRAVGQGRQETVYIANVLKCRPPNNRDPEPEEAANCAGFLQRQIELIDPKLILVVGRIAAQRLLETQESIAKLRGRVHHYGPKQIPLVVTYHPAYLLRSPAEKAKSWADLRLALATAMPTRFQYPVPFAEQP